MMKPALALYTFALLVISFAGTSSAFATSNDLVVAFVTKKQQTSVTRCFLHPSQAADLEACAYDLMKEAMEAKKHQSSSNSLAKDLGQKVVWEPTGPLTWARRRLGLIRNQNGADNKLP
jgi:hypothetical protein